jgi:hypothetical protein
MLRQTRATTVVNHPLRFPFAPALERLSRSQDSWTASSASLSEETAHGCPRYRFANRSRKCFPSASDENGFWPVTRLRSTTTCEHHG